MKRIRQDISINTAITSSTSDASSGHTQSGPLHSSKQRSTPTFKKRKLQFGQSPNLGGSQNTRVFEHFPRLDPSNPVEAKRMNTRQKQIQKGYNTAGYDEYIRKVPKEKRKKILEHPSTPDHKADIPNRRWLGLVKAWRISLHQYDPKDLKSDLDSKVDGEKSVKKPDLKPKPQSVKDHQIAHASSQGLEVDFADSVTDNDTKVHSQLQLQTNASELTDDTDPTTKELDGLGKWEASNVGNEEESLLDYEDSDDELL